MTAKEHIIKSWNWLKNFKQSKKKKSQFIKSGINTTLQKQGLSPKKELLNKHYTSIHDCPIFNYDKVITTGDTRHLYILDNYKELPELHLNKVFDDIHWEFQEEMGLSEDYRMAQDYKVKIALLEFEQEKSGIHKKDEIIYYQLLLDSLKPKTDQSLSVRLAMLAKHQGVSTISPFITLYSYIGIEKTYVEYAKSATKR